MTERKDILRLQGKNFELEVLLDWLDPELFEYPYDADLSNWAARETVGEMGNLLRHTFERFEDPKVRKKEDKELDKKVSLDSIQDQDDGTSRFRHYDRMRKEKTRKLLSEARDIVHEVADQIKNKDIVVSFAAQEALEGRPFSTEAILKGTSGEQYTGKFTGVAHLIASVLDTRDYLERHSSNVPLPKSREGEDHMLVGVVLLSRVIIARKQTPQVT